MKDFSLISTDGRARTGFLKTHHGDIKTPIFMPVATRASLKGLSQEDLDSLKLSIILANTYHLYLRPGVEVIEAAKGLHHFMSWNKGILTDSGGFQVFSLSKLVKVKSNGVEFQSHIDGSKHFITPKMAIDIQRVLSADIVMAFDYCPKLPASEKELENAIEMTLKWYKECMETELYPHQSLFPIIQGGLNKELRTYCMKELLRLDPNAKGMALGGLSVGEKNESMHNFLREFVPSMPDNKARYLMGVGTPEDFVNAIESGIDMFDCVLPSRNARNGQFFTKYGPKNIRNSSFKFDQSPLDESCMCRVCQRYSKTYIRHLDNVGEYLAGSLITFHNLHFMQNLSIQAQKAILNQEFKEFKGSFLSDYLELRS